MFSLIVVTYNSRDLLPQFLSCLATTADRHYETIVVDNASSDGTVEWLRAEYPQVRVVANQRNVGFGAACNRGMAVAQGDVFVTMNPDVQITPAWLTILRQHFSAYPEAAIICPTTLYPDENPPSATLAVAETAAVPGCALALRRNAWQEIGGFDEQMFLYWEDTELCWRAWLLGWQVLEDYMALVYHQRGGSTAEGHWEAETAKNGLYTHLKLRRWRWVGLFALRLAVKTLLRLLLERRTDLVRAWAWNLRHLPATLRARRSVARRRKVDVSKFERLVRVHVRRGRRERRLRSGGS